MDLNIYLKKIIIFHQPDLEKNKFSWKNEEKIMTFVSSRPKPFSHLKTACFILFCLGGNPPPLF